MRINCSTKSPHTSRKTILQSDGATYSRDPAGIHEFQGMVLGHYKKHGRKMVWRETNDPYQILVSEIMLQQTQVERVVVKFPEFIAAFPDFETLAHATLAHILTIWQGMGYNRRAIALQKCAFKVVEEFGGVLPSDQETLMTFPGIGQATAASVGAFAFNEPTVFIETNIRRVFIYFFFGDSDDVSDKEILPLAGLALYKENPRVWYWALMDLGTILKKNVVNPNRRSCHYKKQAPFEGSDRKIRGKILKILIRESPMSELELNTAVDEDPGRTGTIIHTLCKEGFLSEKKGMYTLAS
jgi:A/G-specific adenine glycosylase